MIASAEVTISGDPTPEEAAAIIAAANLVLSAAPAVEDPRPWPYRSQWRRAAIEEGVRSVS